MPFTFCHPAIVLPLKVLPKRWVSMTGLVVGSVTPDFEKFIKMDLGNTFSHTWHGLFWFNLPLGILLAFIFHHIVLAPFTTHLPYFFRSRLYRFRSFNWNAYFAKHRLVVVYSVLLGATSHLVWDSFTHGNGLAVRLLPFLFERVSFFGRDYRIYGLLDQVSTLLGFLVIGVLFLRLPAEKIPKQKQGQLWRYWLTALLTALLVVIFRILLDSGMIKYWELVITFISAALIGLVVASAAAKRWAGR